MADQIKPGQNEDELDVEELEEVAGGRAASGDLSSPGLEDDINNNCGTNCHC